MEIRDGTFDDFPRVLELAHEIYELFPKAYRVKPMNDAQIQRNYVVTMYSDNGFVKVVDQNNEVVGCMVGTLNENQWGLNVAQDLMVLAHGGTKRLIQEFKAWAQEKGADLILVTDLCGRHGYQEVIESAGFKPSGKILVGVE